VQRKVFRIEQMFGRHIAAAASPAEQRHVVDELTTLRLLAEARDANAIENVQFLREELAQVHEMIARNKRELASLIGDGRERRMARATDELRASVDGMDDATQKILKSVEVIDDSAKALAGAQKSDYDRSLTQEIQDHVVQIYEACNFQDISGQRISNVIGTMTMVEDQIAAMLDRCAAIDGLNDAAMHALPPVAANSSTGRGLLNGPKLDGDPGHASQRDIDEMFG